MRADRKDYKTTAEEAKEKGECTSHSMPGQKVPLKFALRRTSLSREREREREGERKTRVKFGCKRQLPNVVTAANGDFRCLFVISVLHEAFLAGIFWRNSSINHLLPPAATAVAARIQRPQNKKRDLFRSFEGGSTRTHTQKNSF